MVTCPVSAADLAHKITSSFPGSPLRLTSILSLSWVLTNLSRHRPQSVLSEGTWCLFPRPLPHSGLLLSCGREVAGAPSLP